MAGYTRNDTSNNIADGNVINASDLDGEYNAIEAAFNESTGHTHDGTSAEGAPITKVGPVQDVEVSATTIQPKTASAGQIDLGASGAQFKDLFIDGLAYIDGLGENLLVNSTNEIQFRDSALKINSSADGQLDIDADTELELTAPTVDINASTSVNISNDLNLDSDSAILSLGADGEVTLTHLHNVGTELKVQNATTTSVTDILDLQVESSGTPGVGIGTGLTFSVETASGNVETAGAIRAVATGLTPTDEELDLVFYSMRNGSLTEAFRYDSDGDTLDVTGTVTADGLTVAGNILLQFEGNELQFNTGSAPVNKIYSDDTYTSNGLTISADNGVALKSTNNYLLLDDTGTNEMVLNVDSGERMRVTSTGIDVTGTVTADGLTVDGAFTSQGIDDNADATAITIDSDERVLIGHTASLGFNEKVQVIGTDFNGSSLAVSRFSADSSPGYFIGVKSRSGTKGNDTIVQDDDGVLRIGAYASDGTNRDSSIGQINFEIDGTPGVNDTPGRIVFSTTADGNSSPTEQMRIAEDGTVRMGFFTEDCNGKLNVNGNVGIGNFISSSNPTGGAYSIADPDAKTIQRFLRVGDDDGGTIAVSEIQIVSYGANDNTGGGSLRFLNSRYSKETGLIKSSRQSGNTGYMDFYTESSGLQKAMRIDSSQRVLIGTETSRTNAAVQAQLQIEGAGSDTSSMSITRNANDQNPPYLVFAKSRGTGDGGVTAVQDDDDVGRIRFAAADGTDSQNFAAEVLVEIDGTPGSNDTPGRLIFATTADGAGSATERMRISQNGYVGIGTGGNDPAYNLEVAGSFPSISILDTDTTNDRFRILHNGGSSQIQVDPNNVSASSSLLFSIDNSEAMRIDSSQRVLINRQTSQTVFGASSQVEISDVGGSTLPLFISTFRNDTAGAYFAFGKSRGTTESDYTVVADDDGLGRLSFLGADGTDIASEGAYIQADVDGTPGSNDMPGRLVFATTADGASTATERMRIDNAGNVGIGTDSPSEILHVNSGIDNDCALFESTDNIAAITIADNSGSVQVRSRDSGEMTFHIAGDASVAGTSSTEAMRIDSLGHVTIGRNGRDNATTDNGHNLYASGEHFLYTSTTNTNNDAIRVYNYVGNITFSVDADGDVQNTNNSYTAISDQSIKENIVDANSQWDDIKALQIRNYNLIDYPNTTHLGVVAQEVESAGMNGLIKENEDGLKSVKYSILYMKAVKALQEAITKIETLEARVAQLEAN